MYLTQADLIGAYTFIFLITGKYFLVNESTVKTITEFIKVLLHVNTCHGVIDV